jgi:hypothetical protein
MPTSTMSKTVKTWESCSLGNGHSHRTGKNLTAAHVAAMMAKSCHTPGGRRSAEAASENKGADTGEARRGESARPPGVHEVREE